MITISEWRATLLIERKMSAAVEVAHLVEAEVADRDKIFMMVDFFSQFFSRNAKLPEKVAPFTKISARAHY